MVKKNGYKEYEAKKSMKSRVQNHVMGETRLPLVPAKVIAKLISESSVGYKPPLIVGERADAILAGYHSVSSSTDAYL